MRSAECGMRNSRAGIGSTGRIPGPTSALQFRIPHSAFRIGLVDWFNAVDATYRTNLRELNELNFARFDAKLEQRLGELDHKLEQRLAELDHKLEQRTISLRAEMQQGLAGLRAELIKWMFVFWIGTVGTILLSRAI